MARINHITVSRNETTLQANVRNWSSRKMIIPAQVNKNNQCWVYVEVIVRYHTHIYMKGRNDSVRKIKRFNTGVAVNPNFWSENKQEAKSQEPSAFEKNTKINGFFSDINSYITKLTQRREHIELPEELKELEGLFGNVLIERKKIEKGLLDYLGDYIDMRIGRGDPRGSYKEFISVKNRLALFQEKNNKYLRFEDVTISLADELLAFWLKEKYHPNTIKKSFNILKTFLNHYFLRQDSEKITLSNQFQLKEFGKIKTFKSEPVAFTFEEFDKIVTFDMDDFKNYSYTVEDGGKKVKKRLSEEQIKRLVKMQHRVVLQVATGLRVSDLFRIKPSSIINKSLIKIRPTKTITAKADNTIKIPLNIHSRRILEIYGYDSSKLKISSQKYNDGIQDLLKVVGIDAEVPIYEHNGLGKPTEIYKPKYEVMTSHNMRDTFISFCVRKNVQIPVILSWTGQSGYDVLKRYIDLNEEDLSEGMKTVF